MGLARIDAFFFVGIFSLYYFLSHLRAGFFTAARRAIILGLAAGVVSAPWWLFNVTQFGSILPSSGRALQVSTSFYKTTLLMRVEAATHAFFENVMPIAFLGRLETGNVYGTLVRIALTIVAIIILWRLRKPFLSQMRTHFSASEQVRRTVYFGLCLLLTSILLIIWYTTQLASSWFYSRYFSPVALLSTIMIIGILAWFFSRKPGLALAACTALALLATGYVGLSLFGKSLTDSYWDQITLVRDYVPADALVGAPQSGTLGYFRDHVVNLDGKVNESLLDYMKSGTGWKYLQEQKIQWVSDGEALIGFLFDNHPEQYGWQLVDVRGNFLLYHNPDN